MHTLLATLLWGSVLSAAPPLPLSTLAASSDGKYLAAATSARLTLLKTSGEIVELAKVTQPKATAMVFRPDGKQLALASGAPSQRGIVELYSVPELKLVATLKLHTDLIHAVAYSPEGKTLASSSYDRSIALADVATGKELRRLKDHSDAVYGLSWKPDGSRLASVSADRTVKLWNPTTGQRVLTLSDATDWLYAIAWNGDGKQVAAAGVDKSIRLWSIDGDNGQLLKSAFAHEKGIIQLQWAGDTLYSLGEESILKAWDAVTLKEKQAIKLTRSPALCFSIVPAKKLLAVGSYDGGLELFDLTTGKVTTKPLPESFPQVKLESPGETRQSAVLVEHPATIVSTLKTAGHGHYHRLKLKAGEELGVQLIKPAGSKLDALLELFTADGTLLQTSHNGLLGYRGIVDKDRILSSDVIVGIRDQEYRGGPEYSYQLKLGPIPIITTYLPLQVEAGRESFITVMGVNLGGSNRIKVMPERRGQEEAYLMPLPWPADEKPVNLPSLRVCTYPSRLDIDHSVPPWSLQGYLDKPGGSEDILFRAQAGQPLVIEVHADRLGSPLDSVIEVLDLKGQPLEQARLSAIAKTFITLRDRDANDPGLRLENWASFKLNDYFYAGTELLRMRDLPKGPDEDCKFWTLAGKRRGYLGTTPRAQPLGGTIYQVTQHPPYLPLPQNGNPSFTLYYRNDDGGPSFGKDSYLLFNPPATGMYKVRLSDAEQRGGINFTYSLTIRPPRPHFTIDVNPKNPKLQENAATPLTVTVNRIDGYEGPVELKIEDLDPRLKASTVTIASEEETGIIALEATSKFEGNAKPFRVTAIRPPIAGITTNKVLAIVQGPTMIDHGDIVTRVSQPTVELKAGSETKVTAEVERLNKFTGRIPLEVRGLPFGVQVTDVGLNGILVLPTETTRSFTLKAEPWVKPGRYPIVVLAKREGKPTQHPARTVMLEIR
jgi:hypothetical protein